MNPNDNLAQQHALSNARPLRHAKGAEFRSEGVVGFTASSLFSTGPNRIQNPFRLVPLASSLAANRWGVPRRTLTNQRSRQVMRPLFKS